MNLTTVREALATAAAGALDVDALPFIPDVVTPPLLAVGRMQLEYDQSFSGLLAATFTLHAFASRADTEQGQEDLLPLLAPDGVKANLETDRTLGGACSELNVPTAEGPGLVDVGGAQFWSASWTVKVWG